jgi:hypothetical protein
MRNMRAWIADIMSRLSRFFVRGRTQRMQERGKRKAASAEEIPGEVEVALHHQGVGGSGDTPAIAPRSTVDSPFGEADQRVDRGSKPDRTPAKGVQPPALVPEAPAPGTSKFLDSDGAPTTITDDPPARPEGPGESADHGPIVPDPQPAPSRPEAELSEPQALDVTASTSAVESDDFEGRGSSLESGAPAPARDPTAEPVAGGPESDSAPSSQVARGAAARSDGEMTTASASPPTPSRSRRSRRVAPEKRGGRPRRSGELADEVACATGERNAARLRSSRPELVCWREGMAWVVGVEVPDDLAEQDLHVVDGEGNNLQEDQLHELRWPLVDPLGPVIVRWSDAASVEAERCFDASDHRIFKVAKSGTNGRRVARVTRGNYVVIAPQALSRDEAVGGPASVAPENVIPEQANVLAHHLLVQGKEEGLVLDGSSATRVEVRPSTDTAYELIGNIIEDAHPGAGPLFGREAPRLRIEGTAEPSLFVVGVEGPSPRARPRQAAVSFDDLGEWLDDNEPGWFYVRAYDANDDLLEGLDFRYVKGLEAIEVDELSPLPGPEGHRPAKVVFRVAPGTVLSLVDGPPEIISLDPARAETVVHPARPDAGKVTWRVSSGTENSVEVVVHVPRIWWALTGSRDADEPLAWSDRPHRLSVDDLRPTSPMHLSVLLPEPGWANEVMVGFRDGSSRRLPVPRSERVLHYALRNLGESDALRGADGACDLLVSVRTPVAEHGPVAVATVQLAENLPEQERAGRLDLSCLRAPRLMSEMTQLGRIGTALDRRAVKRLRKTWYRKARRSGRTERREFVRQALALAAALLECEPARRLPSRLRRHARSLSAQDPTAVASWQRWLRESEPHRGIGSDTSRGEAGQA